MSGISYGTSNSYDAERKIWSCNPCRSMGYFALDLSIGEIIFREMQRHPQLIAQISPTENTVLTREELYLNSMRIASYMRSLGMLQSDIVGIIARNTTHIYAVAYGCFFNGIPFHSVNFTYDETTIKKLFNITKPCLIYCDGEDYVKVKSATKHLKVRIVTMRNHQSDSISIDQVLATPVEVNFAPARLEQGNDQTLAVLCSSGTTGTPKAVTISNSRRLINSSTYLTTADVQYTQSTLDWLSALLATVTSGVYSTTRIITNEPFDPVQHLRIIEKYKVTWLLTAPSHMAMIANCPEFEDANLLSVKSFLYGGGRSSLEVQNRIRSRLPNDCLHMIYGCTEMGSVFSSNRNFDEKPNSAGRLLQGYKLRIINEHGESLGPNEVGELYAYHGEYWAGYYGNTEETQKIQDSEQWFHTGDLGYMDEDGFLYIVDRKKDMLKYQGMMYYPHEIEEVISQMHGVAEVCVFGVWKHINGDEAAAAVVKQVGSEIAAQDVVDYVQKHIDMKHKHLNGGAIIVDDLKRSANGKTNRWANKAYFMELKDAT